MWIFLNHTRHTYPFTFLFNIVSSEFFRIGSNFIFKVICTLITILRLKLLKHKYYLITVGNITLCLNTYRHSTCTMFPEP